MESISAVLEGGKKLRRFTGGGKISTSMAGEKAGELKEKLGI